MGAVETLIVWENLEVCVCARLSCMYARDVNIAVGNSQVNRHVLINRQTDETFVKHLTPEQEKDTSHFVDKETGPRTQRQRRLRAVVSDGPGVRRRCGARAAGEALPFGVARKRVQALWLPA